jgi:argininosuccinate lyase
LGTEVAVTLWQARLSEGPARELLEFTQSLSFDQKLARYDIMASRAHLKGLQKAGLVARQEALLIESSLDKVEEELMDRTFSFEVSDEDIHTAIERRVTELAGPSGAKIHTARSRNDQVVTALRLYLRYELMEICANIIEVQEALAQKAIEAADNYMPGYTHLQRAQPVLVAHHLFAHGWAFARDIDRIFDCLSRLDSSPLGAGALAGTSLAIDPSFVADELGFSKVFQNSMDAVSDRDFALETLFVLATIGIHLSRIGEEIVNWSSQEFGFVSLADSFSTGSSMLPHKKNPDIAELARGKSGRLIGNLTGLMATCKGLPLAYNRDLQEDKEPLFDSIEQAKLALKAFAPMIATMTLHYDKMRESADNQFSAAIDLAEWLVERGTPFRRAHEIVAKCVAKALSDGTTLAEQVTKNVELGPEAAKLLGKGVAVRRRTSLGGAGPAPVSIQADQFANRIEEDCSKLSRLANRFAKLLDRS